MSIHPNVTSLTACSAAQTSLPRYRGCTAAMLARWPSCCH